MFCLPKTAWPPTSKAVNRLRLDDSRIIPGDWGKAGSGWLATSLWSASKDRGGGNIHQFLWRRSRAVSIREKGTERSGAIRNRSKPSQVARESFEPG